MTPIYTWAVSCANIRYQRLSCAVNYQPENTSKKPYGIFKANGIRHIPDRSGLNDMLHLL